MCSGEFREGGGGSGVGDPAFLKIELSRSTSIKIVKVSVFDILNSLG